jgi:hypothetical protein
MREVAGLLPKSALLARAQNADIAVTIEPREDVAI